MDKIPISRSGFERMDAELKNLKIVEVEAAQIPRSLQDVDMAVRYWRTHVR